MHVYYTKKYHEGRENCEWNLGITTQNSSDKQLSTNSGNDTGDIINTQKTGVDSFSSSYDEGEKSASLDTSMNMHSTVPTRLDNYEMDYDIEKDWNPIENKDSRTNYSMDMWNTQNNTIKKKRDNLQRNRLFRNLDKIQRNPFVLDSKHSPKGAIPKGHHSTVTPGSVEDVFKELRLLPPLNRTQLPRLKRVNCGAKPFSGVRGIYFQQGYWKVKFKSDDMQVDVKWFAYTNKDEMRLQFQTAKSFLSCVVSKGRQLHDSDGEGLSEEEPAWLNKSKATAALPLSGSITNKNKVRRRIDAMKTSKPQKKFKNLMPFPNVNCESKLRIKKHPDCPNDKMNKIANETVKSSMASLYYVATCWNRMKPWSRRTSRSRYNSTPPYLDTETSADQLRFVFAPTAGLSDADLHKRTEGWQVTAWYPFEFLFVDSCNSKI